MFGGKIGLPELAVVVFLTLLLFPWFRIAKKTGHSAILGLLFLIPLVNLGLLVYLAFSEWPIEKELRRLERI